MKYDHAKAQEIYKKLDAKQHIYNDIINKMKQGIILPKFAVEVGRQISSKDLDVEDLQNMFIAVAEALYMGFKEDEALKDSVTGSDDDLFGMILDNLFYALNDEQFHSILGNLETIYDVEL